MKTKVLFGSCIMILIFFWSGMAGLCSDDVNVEFKEVEKITFVEPEREPEKIVRWQAPCEGEVNEYGICVIEDRDRNPLIGGIESVN